jgi:phosphoglycerol transferase MdoB-like AlkP superfamily enzyme
VSLRRTLIENYQRRPYRNIFFILLVVILADAVMPTSILGGRFGDLVLVAILFAALAETVRSRRNAVLALVFGAPAIVARLIAVFRQDTMAQNTTVLVLNAIFLLFLIWNLLHDLLEKGRPTEERVFGALCAYFFIGLFFALTYAHMEYRQPASFTSANDSLSAPASGESSLMPVFTYFSFVTLTTLGYGDITPLASHARTLAWLEALLGQLYLAVMVAGFVAMHISETSRRD